jgi:hypothetical protein
MKKSTSWHSVTPGGTFIGHGSVEGATVTVVVDNKVRGEFRTANRVSKRISAKERGMLLEMRTRLAAVAARA